MFRASKGSNHANDLYPNSISVQEPTAIPTETYQEEENFFTEPDNPAMYDDRYEEELYPIQEELDANLECLKIEHEREINALQQQVQKEKKRRDEAKELYESAKADCEEAQKKNKQLRENLIKNTMQTFNLRRDLARQIKDGNQKLIDLQSNQTSSINGS